MQAAIKSVVGFKDQTMTQVSFKSYVGLVTLRNAQRRIEPAGEPGIKNAKVSHQRRINGEGIGEP